MRTSIYVWVPLDCSLQGARTKAQGEETVEWKTGCAVMRPRSLLFSV